MTIVTSFLLILSIWCLAGTTGSAQEIPLPEHPRPDFMREQWQNLNGTWAFRFDPEDSGIREQWWVDGAGFDREIVVPFPWGSDLSGVEDEADIGWYRREVTIDESWKGKRIFLTIGASDWETTVWFAGMKVGTHRGGYVPGSFELTNLVKYGASQQLVIRADDARRDFTLYGKQGYGNARGIWQTVYLDARGEQYQEALHFTPDIDHSKVEVTVYLGEPASKQMSLGLKIDAPDTPIHIAEIIPEGSRKVRFAVDIPDPRLWELEDPFLYEVEADLEGDLVHTYFGMRKISVTNLPGTGYRYIALNDQPVYLQLALDQSYHPEGFYTFPSDRFMRQEIERSKSIGLNGIRTHIKVDIPRKLYWADRLGLLVMSDLPNSWGEPDRAMQEESERTLREMIKRDYNHPSIFSWVLFNETWGLYSKTGVDDKGNDVREYTKETQLWVASMYYLARSLDRTRLVEDNSICCGRGHTETDINSWHAYLPGWEWDEFLKNQVEQTYWGSGFNFEKGFYQGSQPNINSECGNVWGYDGSTGDVDWSWDYHRMINTFRKYPGVAGWLYTEHHDVINEWNGYWRFDRSEKETGLGEIMPGMSLQDLHAPVYLSTGNDICKTVQGGAEVEVPLFLSSMSGEEIGDKVLISYELELTNALGEVVPAGKGSMETSYSTWMQQALDPLVIRLPEQPGLAVLKLTLSDPDGRVLHRNFMHFEIQSDQGYRGIQVLSAPAAGFTDSRWTGKQWEVMEGRKVNGTGQGYFQYEFPIPEEASLSGVKEAFFLVEVSAKELFVKDMEEYERNQDFMRGSKVASSANPNSYPMTDEIYFPSDISVTAGGEEVYNGMLPDDPADHRGVLSWHHQLKDRKLREAGSYGYLLRIPLKKSLLRDAFENGKLEVRIRSSGGGLAIYGREFGRYPLDPSLVLMGK